MWIFVVFSFLFHDIITKINILSSQLQLKKATSGNSVNLINGVIITLNLIVVLITFEKMQGVLGMPMWF